jgi:hypothetical protein
MLEDIGSFAARQEEKNRSLAVRPPIAYDVATMATKHRQRREPMTRRHRLVLGIIIALVALWVAGKVAMLYVDYLWFGALGFESVFTTELWAKVALAVGVFVITALWLAGNAYAAARLSPGASFLQIKGLPWVVTGPQLMRLAKTGGAILILGVSLGLAQHAAGLWYEALQFLHRQPFGWTDPILSRDAGFYIFVIPVLDSLKTYVMALAVLGALAAGAAYFFGGALGGIFGRTTRPAALHLAILIALLLVAVAFGYWLDRFDLLLSSRGAVFGVGYTDANVRLPALGLMQIASLAAAVLVVVAGARCQPKVAAVVIVLLVLLHGAAVLSYPSFVQRFGVEPNELVRESQYLENNIQATRYAFGLSSVNIQPFSGTGKLTLKEVEETPGTIENVRIWDWRVLQQTYNQIESLRPYYHFNDVDVDRYAVDGKYRQVTLAVRELETQLLNQDSRTWVNLHLLYTHGYGLVMSPVNEVTPEGLPNLWVRNIPPQSRPGLEVKQPAIYFGELTHDYIFVGTTQKEFDYPLGAENRYIEYTGKAGVPVDSLVRRLLFAYYFGDFNILLTDSFTPRTRVLWVRRVKECAERLAPFLKYDRDPYPVVADGRIVWILDAYTVTSRFPYSAAFSGSANGPNYIRNSVKATIDAYDGTVTFYVIDPKDPLVATAQQIFPRLFRDIAEMPAAVRAHLRYPNDLFEIQAEQYLAYHMTDPRIFYNKEDLWQRPRHVFDNKTQAIEAYYFIMTLPSESRPEYILMLPFTPGKKDNMVGWLAGRSDGQEYGKLLVYTFPKDRLVFGPNQVEARINQNDQISPLLTLWSQHGSLVVRGNLLVIPVRDSILYIEPLYLKSESGAIPELKRVIVSYQDYIAMHNTLNEALAAVFRGAPPPTERPPEAKPPEKPPTALPPAAARAIELYEKARQKAREGDWTGYGAALDELGKVLREMAGPPPQKP